MSIMSLIIGFLSFLFITFIFALIKTGRRADKVEEDLLSILLLDSIDNDNTKPNSNDKKMELGLEIPQITHHNL